MFILLCVSEYTRVQFTLYIICVHAYAPWAHFLIYSNAIPPQTNAPEDMQTKRKLSSIVHVVISMLHTKGEKGRTSTLLIEITENQTSWASSFFLADIIILTEA